MRLAIRGYGRIGRCVLRAASQRSDCERLQIVALNELADNASVAYLTRYDSTHGRFPGSVELEGSTLKIAGEANQYSVQLLDGSPEQVPDWDALEVNLVLDCTGRYACLLYTSPSPRDGLLSRMPSSA